MQRVLSACAGFLLAVLWFDLMFDVQVLSYAGVEVLPDASRLGLRADSLAVQSELARRICALHLAGFVSIALFLGIQLAGPRQRAGG